MSDGQPAFAGPMTMQEALDRADSLMAKEAEPEEAAQEPEEESTDDEAEQEASAEDVDAEETDDTDEPEDEAEESEQVLTVDEYGDVLVDLNGEPTALRDVIAGTQRQADYTRKTQELAEQRKSLQEEMEKREQELQQREQQLTQMAAELEEPEPDWEKLADEDPLGWASAKAKWEKKQRQKQERMQEAQKRQEQERRKFIEQTASVAVQKFPEWQDARSFDAGAGARKKAALDAGFTEQEYASTPDFRIAVLLEKAARWDALQSEQGKKRVSAEKRLAKAPKVLKPGTSKGDSDPKQERRAAFQKRLSKPISSKDLAKMIGRS